MTDHTTAAQADNKEIRAGFELCYATDADDPANVTDLGHFTNGWRACIMSQVGKPMVMKLEVDATAAIDLINDEVARLRALVADEQDGTAISQFLTDVMTAAGLVRHGKRCKVLAERLGKACMDIRLSGALASAPVAGEAELKEAAAIARSFGAPDMADALAPAKEGQASEAVRNDGFSDGVITALEVMTAHGDWGGTAYCELLQAAGLEVVVRRAIDQETWESAGLDRTPMAAECRAALSAQPEQP